MNLGEGHVLLIDKPLEWTSFDAVKKIKSRFGRGRKNKVKVGHAGTLDPLATGLLIVCIGKKTKTIPEIQDAKKCYEGTLVLGKTTPSYDLETEVNETFPTEHISEEIMEQARQTFLGEIDQMPPIFSALKTGGKRAYDEARKGREVKLDPRRITIEAFEINTDNFPEISFKVTCSKGTYIRSLAHDFGKAVNSGAYLSSLRRTCIGEYKVADAMEINEAADFVENTIVNDNL